MSANTWQARAKLIEARRKQIADREAKRKAAAAKRAKK